MPEQLKDGGPRRASLDVSQMTLVTDTSPGTWYPEIFDASYYEGRACYHGNTVAAGSKYSIGFELAAGTYTFWYAGLVGYPTGGIHSFKLDGVEFLLWDQYLTAANSWTAPLSVANIVIPESGRHQLLIVCTGKHADSGGYEFWIEMAYFVPAAD